MGKTKINGKPFDFESIDLRFDGVKIEGVKSIDYEHSREEISKAITRRLLTPQPAIAEGSTYGSSLQGAVLTAEGLRRAQEDFKKQLERFGAQSVIIVPPGYVEKIDIEIGFTDDFTDGIKRLYWSDEEVFHHRAHKALREVNRHERRENKLALRQARRRRAEHRRRFG